MTEPIRVPQRAAPRRGAILQAARHLFAENGIGPITTNRIAAEAGISPGNLYYWFPSKADIVRALFADWSESLTLPLDESHDPADALRTLWQRVTESPQPGDDYAFFLRDLFPLLHADPVLAEAYRENYRARRDGLIAIADQLIGAGLLRPPEPPSTIEDVVSLLWLAAETAHPFAAAVADKHVDARRYGRTLLQPLLTGAGRRLLGIPQAVDPSAEEGLS